MRIRLTTSAKEVLSNYRVCSPFALVGTSGNFQCRSQEMHRFSLCTSAFRHEGSLLDVTDSEGCTSGLLRRRQTLRPHGLQRRQHETEEYYVATRWVSGRTLVD